MNNISAVFSIAQHKHEGPQTTLLDCHRQWRSGGDAGRTGRHLLGRKGGEKRRKLQKNSHENSDCKFYMCLRARKTKRYGQRVPIVSYYAYYCFKQALQFQKPKTKGRQI